MRYLWTVVFFIGCLIAGPWLLRAGEVPQPIEKLQLPVFTIQHGVFIWGWEPDVDPEVTEYVIRCGDAPGVYTTVPKIFPIAQIEVRIRDIVGMNPGIWYCQMATLDRTGTVRRTESNEFRFKLVSDVNLKGIEK